MPYSPAHKSVKIMKASRLLQAKVGTGEIRADQIEESQNLIDAAKSQIDFLPLAAGPVRALERTLSETASAGINKDELLARLMEPIMQLKANAAMFNYDLIGSLAHIMLNFLEAVEKVDKDVLDIVNAHTATLRYIINNEISGDGGTLGAELVRELSEVCRRYFARQQAV